MQVSVYGNYPNLEFVELGTKHAVQTLPLSQEERKESLLEARGIVSAKIAIGAGVRED